MWRVAQVLDPAQDQTWIAVLDSYARDPMGGGEGLADEVRARLGEALAAIPGAVVLLAYGAQGEPVGLATAFMGFSTFAAKPLLNIHDLAVLPAYRRQGVGQALMDALAQLAGQRGCCKLTLEVLSENRAAQGAYRKAGFAPYSLDEATGLAQFWQKYL
mgnify:CR=1 FL=1